MKQSNISGSLFPTREGEQLNARSPLRVKKSALTVGQKQSEDWHMMALFRWLKSHERRYPDLARSYHTANEFQASDKVRKVNRKTGASYWWSPSSAKRQMMGVKPGVFDVINDARRGGYAGLRIDLKVREKDLSSDPAAEWDQAREMVWQRSQGKSAHVAWCWTEAAELHLWYLGLRDPRLWLSAGKASDYLIPRLGGHDERCGCGLLLSEARP